MRVTHGGWIAAIVLALCATSVCRGQQTLALSRYNQQDPDWAAELRLIRDHFGLDKDQAATVNMLLSGAYSEHRMQRRVFDRRRAVWESMEDTQKSQALADAENQRFAERRLLIEKTWLAELKEIVLNQDQLRRWESYERARRVNELTWAQECGGLMVTTLLGQVALTPAEAAATVEPIDRHMQALDEIAQKYLAAHANWLAIRWGKVKGDLEKAEAQRDSTTTGLRDALRAGLRSVCDAIPPEKATLLRLAFDAEVSQSEVSIDRLEDDETVGEYLRISTLTDDQRHRVRAAMAKGDESVIRLARAFKEQRPKVRDNRAAYDTLWNSYHKDRAKALLDAVKQIRQVLTDDQRKAFDEGREPPIDGFELQRRFADMDDRYMQAFYSED